MNKNINIDIDICSIENMIFNIFNINIYENTQSMNVSSIITNKFQNTILTNFNIRFFSNVSNFALIEFISLQDNLLIYPGETGLAFFRIYNPTTFTVTGLSLYFIHPNNISVYITKIQCFCFDMIQIKSCETIELPILFFLNKLLLFDNIIFDNIIYISYIFFIQ